MTVSFLEQWDATLERARRSGRIAYLTSLERVKTSRGQLITAVVHARTRHPAFMGVVPSKHDPERDQ